MNRLYSLKILWHGRNRFLPAVMAVSFSAVLIAVQFGVLLGTLAITSRPIDHAPAQIWVGIRDVPSIELGHPIPESWLFRVQADPEIEDAEGYLYEFTYWHKPAGGSVHCCIIGTRLGESALGAVEDLTPEMRTLLTEPGSVVVDRMELDRLGLVQGVGETAEEMGHKVRVVGLVNGFKSIWGPYVFCSMQTARMLLFQFSPNEMQYLLARCRPDADVPALVERMRTLAAQHGPRFAPAPLLVRLAAAHLPLSRFAELGTERAAPEGLASAAPAHALTMGRAPV